MSRSPRFLGFDGSYRRDYIVTTTKTYQFFNGKLPEDTIDVQVSVRGGSFESNPDLISFSGSTFMVPNPSAYSEGLTLLSGENEVRVRAVLANGTTSPEATLRVYLSVEEDIGMVLDPPTGIVLEKFGNHIELSMPGVDNENVVGYNFYASPQPGGGNVGYFQINPMMVISGEVEERVRALGELNSDISVAVDGSGVPVSNPLYVRLQASQEDALGYQHSADFDEILKIPADARHVRMRSTISQVETSQTYRYKHDRLGDLSGYYPTLPHSELMAVPMEDDLYYVATAVYLIDGIQYESYFSPEVSGHPLNLTTRVGSFPQVTRQQVVKDTVLSIYRTNPKVRVDPGSALRDTFIDPFAVEANRVRFVIDFLHNAQSFATLLAIDDPTQEGVSIPVPRSTYKTALREAFHLKSDEDVQDIIDNAFDKLASNFGVFRESGRRARGEVTFYVTDRPTTSIILPIGTVVSSGGQQFRTTSTAVIASQSAGPAGGSGRSRYFGRAFVQATSTGSSGNVAAGQIRQVQNNVRRVSVTNESATFGGRPQETNNDLALRALRALSSVDSGTRQGYLNQIYKTSGVEEAVVVPSSHPLMMRDVNSQGEHVGGKVDIYVRGVSEAKVTDTFAFSFELAEDQQFEPEGHLSDLRYQAVDPRLSESFPIIELMRLENVTKGYVYDLTDMRQVGYGQVQLSKVHNAPVNVSLLDEIRGTYRYRTSNRHVFARQPVYQVLRFEGERSGVVSPTSYDLYHADDPLMLGGSAQSQDFIRVVGGEVQVPSNEPVVVEDEVHVILDGLEYLHRLGANYLTVEVWNADKTLRYEGPLSTSPVRDYTFIYGDERTPLAISITDNSRIREGDTVLISYQHDENFTVQYLSNAVVETAQDNINKTSHITADVLVKQAVEVGVDLEATVVLDGRLPRLTVDALLRTNLMRFFSTLKIGQPVHQSDIIRLMDETQGVDYVVTPLAKMARTDGSMIVREEVPTGTKTDVVKISAWCTDSVSVYLLVNPLNANTTPGGGPVREFQAVYENNIVREPQRTVPNLNGWPIKMKSDSAFIIGFEGLVVPGYSDDTTIIADNVLPSDPDEKELAIKAIRKSLTANRVIVTRKAGEGSPEGHAYAVTYQVSEDLGVQNIVPGPIEYLVMGGVTITYDGSK